MTAGTQIVLEVKKNKLNNSSKWFTFGQKKTVVSGYGLFAYILISKILVLYYFIDYSKLEYFSCLNFKPTFVFIIRVYGKSLT